jgi:hypothetical protein
VNVDRPLVLLGVDDYLETPDAADLDFAANEPFTVLAAFRKHGTSGGEVLIAKRDLSAATNAGWHLAVTAVTNTATLRIADGTDTTIDTGTAAFSTGVATVFAGRRSTAADQVEAMKDGASDGATTDATTGTLANALTLRIGRSSGAGTTYFDGEFMGAAVFRSALSDSEITRAGQELLAF